MTSLMSMGAMRPRKMDARKEDTKVMREVAAYAEGYLVWKRRIWGPLKRWEAC